MGLPPRVNEKVSSFKSNTGWTSRGENSSVLKKLGSIEFVDGTFGGMTPAVAYIQYWSRDGVSRRKLEEASRDVFSLPPDKLSELSEQFEGSFKESVSETSVDYFDPDIELPPFTGIPENLEIAKFRPPTDPEKGTEDTNVLPSEPLAGGIYGANPVSNYTDMETSAVWTFMFNPEELELSSGPDYNRAEAWGVSDPANEGQPLSWRANKNRKLSFGKILLHGYSLGKRVDSLEKGLQDLFVARDGENGADGPPVLEFVWGRRVFGPCVIQDIKVREKAWDAGYLVNAEVSFTLEQVPEWTINDGFVDVLRPGRQPTLSDPTVSSRDYRDSTDPDSKPKDAKEEADNEDLENKGVDTALVDRCKDAERLYEKFKSLEESVSKAKTDGLEAKKNILARVVEYNSKWYPEAVNLLGDDFTRYIVNPVTPKELQRTVDTQIENVEAAYKDPESGVKFGDYKQAYLTVVKAANSGKVATEKFFNSEKCSNAKKAQEEVEQERNKLTEKKQKEAKCKAIAEGKPCIGTRFGFNKNQVYATCSGGKRLICDPVSGEFKSLQ